MVPPSLQLDTISRETYFSVIDLVQTFLIGHEGTHHYKFVQSRRMSYIFTCVQSILVIPATYEMHMEGQTHDGLAWTKPDNGM